MLLAWSCIMLVQLFRSFGKALICEPARTFKSVFSIRFSKQLWYCISVIQHVLIIYSYSLLHKTVNGRPSLLRNSRWDVWKSLYGGRKLHFSQQQIFAVSETVKEASGQSMTWPSMKWTILSGDLTARASEERGQRNPAWVYISLRTAWSRTSLLRADCRTSLFVTFNKGTIMPPYVSVPLFQDCL